MYDPAKHVTDQTLAPDCLYIKTIRNVRIQLKQSIYSELYVLTEATLGRGTTGHVAQSFVSGLNWGRNIAGLIVYIL